MTFVTIGGALAPVFFSGLAPDNVGLYQVNAQVPVGTAAGAAVPVTLSIAGVSFEHRYDCRPRTMIVCSRGSV
jgi:uncharacterized protein (TIGR03437 family)